MGRSGRARGASAGDVKESTGRGTSRHAEQYGQPSVDILEPRVLGTEHPSTLTSMANLAWTLRDRGSLDEAEKLMAESAALSSEKLGNDHPDTRYRTATLTD